MASAYTLPIPAVAIGPRPVSALPTLRVALVVLVALAGVLAAFALPRSAPPPSHTSVLTPASTAATPR